MTYKEAKAAAKRLHKALKHEACDVTLKQFMKDRRFRVIWKIEDEEAYGLASKYYASGELLNITSLHCHTEHYKNGLRLTSEFDFDWQKKSDANA